MENLKLTEKIPFTLSHAVIVDNVISEPEGYYDEKTQTWKGEDILMMRTYCRSSTTGLFESDPDEDPDDTRK